MPTAWLAVPATLFLLAFFVAPLVNNMRQSAGDTGLGGVYYAKLFFDPYYLGVTAVTIGLSLLVTVICAVAGYPIALFMVRRAGRWRSLIVFLLVAPLLTSVIMRSFGWRVLLARGGLINMLLMDAGLIERPLRLLQGPIPVVLGLVHVMVPFMVLPIASSLQSLSPGLEESARSLGAGRFDTFCRVTLPLSLDGIGTGAILVFMLTNGSFVTLLILGSGAIQNLPLLIYQQFNTTRDFAFGAAMGNVLLALAIACMFLQLRLIRRRGLDR